MHSIRHAEPADVAELAAMRAALWPQSSLQEHRREMDAWFADGPVTILPAAILVAHTPKRTGMAI
ncbi:MAG TPA: hypothetical protein VII58_13830 [Acidobacteriaceae bacterium]